ncbi:MAG: DUF3352 domain-containing protein, partial [Anaerolineaceae bacterium]|nr:DUF3352 domain-containing protein [Anaerolineaceae bacterium]
MYNDQTVPQIENQSPEKKPRTLIIIAVVVVLLACCFLVAAAALIYFDPFDWGLIGRLMGGYDSISKTIPEDANLYVSLDMGRFLADDTRDVFNAFAKNAGDPDIKDMEEFIQNVDDSLEETFGVTFTADILPWIGQYIGVSFIDLQLDRYGEPETAAWVLGIEARSKKAADEFVTKLINFASEDSGYDILTQTYQGADIYELDTPNEYERVAICRSKGVVLISTDVSGIKKAVDAQNGTPLSESQDYKDTMSGLPTERLITTFISGNLFSDVTTILQEELGAGISALSIYRSIGMSLTLVTDGVKFDVYTAYEQDQLSEERRTMLSSPGSSGKIAANFPENTLLFITGGNFGNIWQAIRDYAVESMDGDEGDCIESMQMFASEYGINPDTELFPYLDGEWGLGLYDDPSSILASELDVPVSVMLVAETSDQSSLDTSINKFVDDFGIGLVTIKEQTISGVPLYVASPFLLNTPLLSFGTFENYFLLGTNGEILAGSFDSDLSLANLPQYKDTWTAFDSGMSPVFYMNFTELIGFIEDLSTEELGPLDPVTAIAIANSPLKGNTTH